MEDALEPDWRTSIRLRTEKARQSLTALKSIVGNGLIAVAALAVSAIGAEFAVRALFPVYDPSGQVEFRRATEGGPVLGVPNTRVRQRKNTGDFDVAIAFNKYGFRDDKDLAESTSVDVFVVGDSFTFGWGVEAKDRYSDRLQALTGVRTFNIATPGNFDDYGRLIRYATAKGARVGNLVIGVCMENDLMDYAAVQVPAATGFTFELSSAKSFLSQNSALYGMATTAVHATPALKNLAVSLGLITPNLEGIPKARYAERMIESSVAKLRELAVGHRATILIIPSRGLWIGAFTGDADRIHRAFVDAVERAGFMVVDLRPLFEANREPLTFHFANDGHWNPRGHALAAQALAGAMAVRNRASAGLELRH